MTKIPIWLDCDPGHDDAVAILLSLFHPSFHLVGISTTYGNSSVQNTTRSALSVLTAMRKENEIPVYAGTSKPLVKPAVFAPDIHGKSGLDGTEELPVPTVRPRVEIDDENGLNAALFKALNEYEGLSIVAVGPLTNVCKFFNAYPDARKKINNLSVMGGGFDGVYNRGFSEFNIWCDPHAAHYVVSDPILGPKLLLLPLNVTHSVICDHDIQKKILNAPDTTEIRKMFYELMTFFASSYVEAQGFEKGPPVHDPIAVFALLEVNGVQDVGLKYKTLKLTCVEEGEEEGKLEYVEDPKGSKVVFGVNTTKFWDTFLYCLRRADDYISKNS